MASLFKPHTLVEKLAKLDSSQHTIETLSHWCIFHMNRARQIVETWDRQFHCSPRDQRLAFLYLANDILQNSRRKGGGFVAEFWKVLPDALRDVIYSGDEFGRNATLRLINIWEERKVFGSRGQILKEELFGRQLGSSDKNEKPSGINMKQPAGNTIDKILLGYRALCGGRLDEDDVLSKCRNAISSVEKIDKEIEGDVISGQSKGSQFLEEVKGQSAMLRDCIEQLTSVESLRANLISYLREALQEQELKLDQVRNQLQAAQSLSEHADDICGHLLSSNNSVRMLSEQSSKETQLAPVIYTGQVNLSENFENDTKSAAAIVAAKLTSSTSSAQMLSYVLSSLASEGVIGNSVVESCSVHSSVEKRPKIENNGQSHSSYTIPSQNAQPPVPPFPHPDSLQNSENENLMSSQELVGNEESLPPPPSSPPPQPPLPPMLPPAQFIPQPGSLQYGYASGLPPMSLPGYHTMGGSFSSFTPLQPNNFHYQDYQMDGSFYRLQPSSMPMAPISRQ